MAEQVGVSPESRTYEGDDAGLVEFALSLNLHRRHLNESQRGMVGARIEQYERGRPGKDANLHLKRADAAELLHVSPRSIASAKKVQESGGAELASLVDAGEIAVSAAAQIAEVVRDRTPGLEPEQVKEVVCGDLGRARVPSGYTMYPKGRWSDERPASNPRPAC